MFFFLPARHQWQTVPGPPHHGRACVGWAECPVPAGLRAEAGIWGPCLSHPYTRVPRRPSVGTCPSGGSVSASGPT